MGEIIRSIQKRNRLLALPVQGECLMSYDKRSAIFSGHIQVRVATPDDENDVIALLKELMILEKAKLLSDEEFKKMFRMAINNSERALFLVAEVDSNAVGSNAVGMLTMVFGFSTWNGKSFITIDDVYVRQEMRRRGVATSLLNYAFKMAKDLDCVRVDLVTGIDNLPAQQLYKTVGFLPLQRIPFTKPL